MRNQKLLIERAKALPHVRTKTALSAMLEMGHPNLTRVERGDANFTEKQAILLAEIIGQPALDIIALVGLDRAKTDQDRRFWERRAPRILAATCAAALAATLCGQIPDSFASEAKSHSQSDNLLIMRRRLYKRTGKQEFSAPRSRAA